MNKKSIFRCLKFSFILVLSNRSNAQFFNFWGKPKIQQKIYHVAPPHWYSGFEETKLEIILHAENASYFTYSLNPSETPTLITFDTFLNSANRHVLYLRLNVPRNAKAQTLKFTATPIANIDKKLRPFEFSYEIKERRKDPILPITSQDVTYLIFPDRFSNGDPTNDNAEVQYPEEVNRKALKGRHGGDLEGISSKLDYLQDLGMTTLWLNPVQENDQQKESFHGYAITDNYRIDPRLGTNEQYRKLSESMRKRNMKLVMDIIPNHVGDNHWMYQNYDTGWFNFRDSFVQTNFRANTVMDPYSSNQDRIMNIDGAFVRTMPDFNQKNEHIRIYLDQLYLWWVEFAGLSGYRIDTYPYPDQEYMNHLCELLLKYYPKLVIYGETWVEQTATQVAFTKNNIKGFEKNQLPGVTDFVLCWAMQKAGYEKYGWLEGLNRVYQTLGEDYLYQDPNKNLTFLDNHDLSRIYSVLNQDFNAWKRSQNLLFTLRGMPQVYYGTEILMTGKTSPSDAYVRFDFPGGWKSDSINKFKPQGRTAQEQQAFLHIQKLAKFRAQNPVFLNGKMVHFAGKDETYSYFRYTDNQAVFCIYSQSDKATTVDLSRYQEITKKYRGMRNIFSGEVVLFQNPSLILRPQASEIYELFN